MAARTSQSEAFERERSRLWALAFRMLGSRSEADDAIQEVWLRLGQTDPATITNLQGWLTTVTARVGFDLLRSRDARREQPLDVELAGSMDGTPESDALHADAVGVALLVVLDTLSPAERLAFVLHDMFDVPFGEVASIMGRSPAAVRQLASRARRRVQGQSEVDETDQVRKREIVEAFLAASRGGDFAALLALLDPDVEVRADVMARRWIGKDQLQGAAAVAEAFNGIPMAGQVAWLDGEMGVALWVEGKPMGAMSFAFADGRIVEIDLITDPARLEKLAIAPLEK